MIARCPVEQRQVALYASSTKTQAQSEPVGGKWSPGRGAEPSIRRRGGSSARSKRPDEAAAGLHGQAARVEGVNADAILGVDALENRAAFKVRGLKIGSVTPYPTCPWRCPL
jgi:hypothetical protein